MNFRHTHARAKRTSLKLGLAFWMGLPVGALLYYAVLRLFLAAVPELPRVVEHILWFIVAMVLCSTFAAYLDALDRFEKKTAYELARLLGGTNIDDKKLEEKRLQNIVHEMAAATNLSVPKLLILRQEASIQAFVIAGANNSIALAVSAGALTYLNRAELSALIAHEFGHIYNGDVENNLHLSAILYGYFTVSEWRFGGRLDISAAVERSFRINIFRNSSGDPNLLGVVLGSIGFVLYFYGRIIQSAYSRKRELMADARAVEFTRDSAAMIMVLKKALALEKIGRSSRTQHAEFAHMFFLDGIKKVTFATHPSIEERIKALGGKIYATEIYELEQKLKKPLQSFDWSEY